MFAVLYMVMIRPQQKRTRAARALLESLDVGDEVITIGGMHGTITAIDDEEGEVTVEVAPDVEVRLVKSAIARKLVFDDEDEEGEPDTLEEEEEGAGEQK
jgi:preprotein translocase subunit YajC